MTAAEFLEKLLDGAPVEWVPLGDVCVVKTGPNINKQIIAQRPGPYPVINSGREPLGYVDHYNVENEPIGIASRGSVGLVTWTSGRFFRGNLNYSCAPKDQAKVDTRFLYHFLLFSDAEIQSLATHQGIPALNAGALKTLPVPIPPMDTQTEIVRILDSFTELTAELSAELTARKKQFNYYRDRLLSFEGGNVEWKPLDEIGEFIRGKRFTKADYVDEGIGAIHYGEIYTHYGVFAHKTLSNVRSDMAASLRYAEPNDVVIAGVSETIEDVGKAVAWLGEEKVAIHDDSYAFRHNMNPKFIAYAMQTDAFHDQKAQYVSSGKIKRLLIDGVKNVRLPVPYPDDPTRSLEEQTSIVAILDTFDTLTTSFSEGLPREIELREKQYAWFRDQLLSFPKPDAEAA
ncbi:restriction endonuclease subunit S [Sulfitobacter sp. HNIBRBA3233]|uniref:restriction endonuclease subunit S n=1 Tax=Sulfitobacter marinivivus TaxID=3158558 RepID=UPI0032DFF2D5